MRVLVALDKFKEALPAPNACRVVTEALHATHPDWAADLCPLTDGGDGFVAALIAGKSYRLVATDVADPMGETVSAR